MHAQPFSCIRDAPASFILHRAAPRADALSKKPNHSRAVFHQLFLLAHSCVLSTHRGPSTSPLTLTIHNPPLPPRFIFLFLPPVVHFLPLRLVSLERSEFNPREFNIAKNPRRPAPSHARQRPFSLRLFLPVQGDSLSLNRLYLTYHVEEIGAGSRASFMHLLWEKQREEEMLLLEHADTFSIF